MGIIFVGLWGKVCTPDRSILPELRIVACMVALIIVTGGDSIPLRALSCVFTVAQGTVVWEAD